MPAQILVVDQNPVVQTTIENTLVAKHFEVTSVRDALSGLDLAYKIKPDLIIADMRMEGLMIYSFCARIRQKASLSHIPIFLLVQQNDVYDETRLRQSGVVGFIQKPIDIHNLHELLKPYLMRFSENGTMSPSPSSAAGQTLSKKEAEDEFLGLENMLNPPEEFKLEETKVEKNRVETSEMEEQPLPDQEATVKIEDLLGWSADEVSPFSEVISTQSADETQLAGLSQILEKSPVSDADTKISSSDSLLDSSLTMADTTTKFDITKTKLDSEFINPPKEPLSPADKQDLPRNGQGNRQPRLDVLQNASPPPALSSSPEMSKLTQDIIEKVAWEVVPHLTEQALNRELIASMVEKVLWEVVPFIAEQSVKEAIKKISEEPA